MTAQRQAQLLNRTGDALPLKRISVTGVLRGLLFQASVVQTFVNPFDRNAELVYTFPVPWGAVLMGVDVKLAGKELHGTVIDKKKAEKQYEDALADGNTAIMLERNADESFTLNLGNLAAKEECVITLRYAQIVKFQQQSLRLTIPTVIAPRYGDAVRDGGLSPHQTVSYDLLAEYPFDFELYLHGQLASARIGSPSHPIKVKNLVGGAEAISKVSLGRSAWLDRDFVLILDELTHDSLFILGDDMVRKDAVVVLASFCPRLPGHIPQTVALRILVDCSGSMAGSSIQAAQMALASIVSSFKSGDTFLLSRFGSSVEHRSRTLWKTTTATQASAQRWIEGLAADMGGTEMEQALQATLALAPDVPGDLLLLTDGEVEAINTVIATAVQSGVRMFIVGIGSSPAQNHLQRLAEATGGACEFVAPGEDVHAATIRMFTRLRGPHMKAPTVVWPEGIKPIWTSTAPLQIFDGDCVNVMALLETAPEGDVTLLAQAPDTTQPVAIASAAISGQRIHAHELSRLVGYQRVQSTTVDQSEAANLKECVDYQLITDQTNFVLVYERADAQAMVEMPELVKVPQMMPASSAMYSAAREYSGSPMSAPRVWLSIRSSAAARIDARSPIQLKAPEADTPQGLSLWLAVTKRKDWPKSYVELRRIGVPSLTVDWLELEIAAQDGMLIREEVVVRAFIEAVGRCFSAKLQSDRGLRAYLSKWSALAAAACIPSSRVLSTTLLDATLRELNDRLERALRKCTVSAWQLTTDA